MYAVGVLLLASAVAGYVLLATVAYVAHRENVLNERVAAIRLQFFGPMSR